VTLTLLGDNGGPPINKKSAGDTQRLRVKVEGLSKPEGVGVLVERTAHGENYAADLLPFPTNLVLDANGEATFTVKVDDSDLGYGVEPESDTLIADLPNCKGTFSSNEVGVEWFRVPVIFIPGITGTYLESNIPGVGEVWPAAEQAAKDYSGDRWLKYLSLNADGNTDAYGNVTAEAIIREISFVYVKNIFRNYYNLTIANLENNGWVDHKTLFEFPYDWRKSTASNESKLKTYISNVRSNLCPACKVDLLAHSQGGLVASALLEDAASIGKIRRVVTLGTPLRGAPKALGILELAAPCLVTSKQLGITFCPYTKNTIRDIAQNMPGLYDLLPSENLVSYLNSLGSDYSVWENNGWKYNGHSPRKGILSYNEIYNYIRVASNLNIAQRERSEQETLENFKKVDPDVQIERIVGDYLGTISGFKTYSFCKPGRAPTCNNTRVNVRMRVSGDGTVPYQSADIQAGASQVEYADGIDHMKLAQDAGVISEAATFLHNGPSSVWPMAYSAISRASSENKMSALGVSTNASDQSSPTMDVNVEGDVTGGFTNAAGEMLTDGNEDPAMSPSPEISGGDFEEGVGTKLYYFNQPVDVSGEFVVKNDEPTSITVHRYENGPGLPTGSATFFIPSVNAGEHLKLNVAVAENLSDLRLGIDKNGDGTAEVTLAPTGVNEGSAAADDIAPQTDYSETPAGHRRAQVSLTGSDEGGSGLAGIYYFTSDGKEGRYTRPLELKIGTTLVFYGIDAAGNYESPHTLVVDDVGNDAAHSTALNPPQEVRRTLNPASDEDWFSFSVSENHKYRFHLDREGKNAELQLLDGNSNVVAGTESGKKHPDELTVALLPGKYFVRVYQTEGSKQHKHPYTLDIDIERCAKSSRPGGEAHCLFAPLPKVVTLSGRGWMFIKLWGGAPGHKRV
jgi:pimeloyl-ACP methyl ester carboxylesterase